MPKLLYSLPLFFALLLALPAFASSPGMIEGPPGCTWNATVVEMGEANAALRLDTLYGTCMQQPGDCGKPDDVVTITFELKDEITKGATKKIWVDSDAEGNLRATLTHPACTRVPVPKQ